MRVKISVALVSAWLLLHSQPAAADGIGGWAKLRWGMSKQQVEQVYPNFENYDYQRLIGGWEKKFGLQHYSVAGCPFSMYLEFLDNRLERIQLDTFIKKGGFEDHSCSSIKDTLSEKYGRPTTDNQVPNFPSLKWTLGETEVEYMKETDSESGEVWISVVYMDKRGWMEWITKPGRDRL
jgi:hypothetical protein